MAITANQRVLTLDHWKYADRLKVGDYVFDRNGTPVQIKLVQTYFVNECYEIVFDDHLTMQGDRHMGFLLETPKYRNRLGTYKGVQPFRRPLKHFSVGALSALELRNYRNRKLFSLPTAKPLALPHQPLPIPPFLFGFWFMRHGVKNVMSVSNNDYDELVERFRDYGYRVVVVERRQNNRTRFRIDPQIDLKINTIPENYLMGSIEQRTELLSGIMSANPKQYNVAEDTFCFKTRNAHVFGQMRFLLESLAHRIRPVADQNYRIYFKSRTKLVKHQVSPPVKVHHARRYVVDIQPIQPQMCVHLETTGSDHTILVGEGFIPTC